MLSAGERMRPVASAWVDPILRSASVGRSALSNAPTNPHEYVSMYPSTLYLRRVDAEVM
jgi:hypothetical protein